MLTRLRLQNFKSFADEDVPLAPLTFLVGANATGKSNLLDAVRFLKGAGLGIHLDDVALGRREGGIVTWPGIRGGIAGLPRTKDAPLVLESTWRIPDPLGVEGGSTAEVSHRIACTTNGRIRLAEERLSARDFAEPLFEVRSGPTAHLIMSARPAGGGAARAEVRVSDVGSLLRKLGARLVPEHGVDRSVRMFAFGLANAMTEAAFFELDPRAMRGHGRRGSPLGAACENLSGVLASYCQDNPGGEATLVDWLNELSPTPIERIDFIETPELDEVTLVLVESGGRRVSAPSLSDGTLLFLGLYAALRIIEPGPVVLLEEIDTALHPKGIHVLVQLLEQVVRDRGSQIIATTHSPVVLRWLSDEALRDVVVFGRVPEHPGTITRRLGDLPRFDEVVQLERIDELFSSGWMEAAL
jgi:hypothetical protein